VLTGTGAAVVEGADEGETVDDLAAVDVGKGAAVVEGADEGETVDDLAAVDVGKGAAVVEGAGASLVSGAAVVNA
jgi:hypothetical protein